LRLLLETSPNIDKNRVYASLKLRLSKQRKSGKNQKEYTSSSFIAVIQGYKVQLTAMVNLPTSAVHFFVRVFKGTNDSELSWPFNQRFHIKLSIKTESKKQVEWYIPPLDCKYSTVNRPLQDEQQVTDMFGGFDNGGISRIR